MPQTETFWRRPNVWLISCFVVSLFILAYPLYVIRPFRYQGPKELAATLAILRIRPHLQIALAILAAFLAVLCWNRSRRVLTRASAVLLAVATIGFGILSRVNAYELMFKPLGNPVFATAARTSLDGAEQVIAVRVSGAARAYPIRVMSYHHLINDVVAGLPLVATY